ncbi:MAG: dihydroorotate dehydrogenase electron transfer subunit, partial [Pirellulaceae bacterium]
VRLARDTYRARVLCPEIAERITPGQFLMVRLAHRTDPLIGRPFALYDTAWDGAGRPQGVDFVYLVKGKFTSRLRECRPGTQLDVWGPLGNGFTPRPIRHVLMVAGGIGQTPFLAVAREYGGRSYGRTRREVLPAERLTLLYGARTAELLGGVDDFRAAGVDVRVATDDGTAGHHGLVTDLLQGLLREVEPGCRVLACGPEPMLAAVSALTDRFHVPCDVSLETPMACGIGVCFTCVARIRDSSGQWDYKRTCVDGPVFDAACVAW